mgnify:CR=1 FL=1
MEIERISYEIAIFPKVLKIGNFGQNAKGGLFAKFSSNS